MEHFAGSRRKRRFRGRIPQTARNHRHISYLSTTAPTRPSLQNNIMIDEIRLFKDPLELAEVASQKRNPLV
jgi:hypothetical protein